MTERTPTQEASARMASAVFSDPELRAHFELLMKDTATREPVRDNFEWLDPKADQRDEYSRFESFTKKLLSVPKAAIDAARKAR